MRYRGFQRRPRLWLSSAVCNKSLVEGMSCAGFFLIQVASQLAVQRGCSPRLLHISGSQLEIGCLSLTILFCTGVPPSDILRPHVLIRDKYFGTLCSSRRYEFNAKASSKALFEFKKLLDHIFCEFLCTSYFAFLVTFYMIQKENKSWFKNTGLRISAP